MLATSATLSTKDAGPDLQWCLDSFRRLSRLTPAGVDAVRRIALARIIDLRPDRQCEPEPNPFAGNNFYQHVALSDPADAPDLQPHLIDRYRSKLDRTITARVRLARLAGRQSPVALLYLSIRVAEAASSLQRCCVRLYALTEPSIHIIELEQHSQYLPKTAWKGGEDGDRLTQEVHVEEISLSSAAARQEIANSI